jgi:hypothetical protein
MALQLTFTDPDTDATIGTAYWRIDNTAFPPGLQRAFVTVGVYASAGAAAAKVPIATRRFVVGQAAFDAVFPAGALVSEITARAYAWLKARAEFAGSVDV